ncbi:wax ester/triacylglycerol synthase domain-containing protein [Agromyces sp. LHK192]|uniref:wax ester/triacylglycerol synthase domain-containing protein n=1 Tax=Agromyces sp. LHK192 TaxID=2498704 RepID=UPI0013E3DEC3|nr:wax ester/triacylglycerol synthase domain-containing protein [Agromyces sp. LHK192]
MAATRADVELMATLDEKFIANTVAFEAARPSCAIVVDGAALRRPDGTIDRELVRAVFRRAVDRMPALGMRVRRAPLGLTAPFWVPATEVDFDFHVRFPGGVVPDGPDRAETFSGRRNGEMRLDRPLWDFMAVELESGDVALVGRVQHALGDGIYGLRVIDSLVETEPFDPFDSEGEGEGAASDHGGGAGTPEPAAPAGPRTGAGLLIAAGRDWWAAQDGIGGAWREYTRKPFRRRLRRWGGRLARPVKDVVIERRGLVERMLPARHSAIAEFALADLRAAARAAGGTVSDLTVALALRAVARVLPDEPALLVPISRRDRATGGNQRNHIVMTRVTAPREATIAETVAMVAEQVAAARDGEAGAGPMHPRAGYASYLPWRPRAAHFGPAPVRSVTLWPVLEPADAIAIFASSYHRGYTLAVTARTDVDLGPVVEEFREAIAALTEPVAPVHEPEAVGA